ncbi:hypothetical protein JW898_04665 [Candidatus Woesearchaeota archaeon]|nr:hypothetical protein [Candidatus Woesearchaeota archaeon]
MELPPIPSIEGIGSLDEFPEFPDKDDVPPLPETSLPPLPTEVPGTIPPRPVESKLEAPKMELPALQPIGTALTSRAPRKIGKEKTALPPIPGMEMMMPEPPEMPETEKYTPDEAEEPARPEFPEIPEAPSEEVVPDRIPPLEGLPEPPEFSSRTETAFPRPAQRYSPPKRIEPEQLPSTAYFAAEEPMPRRREPKGPLFIRTDRFRAIIDDIEQVRAKFKEEDDTFFRITEIKNAQDQKFEEFRQSLEDVQRKLLFIDRSLFEAK